MSAANTPAPATTPINSTSNSGVPENPITVSDEGDESVEELEAKLAKKKQERAEKKRREEEERRRRKAEEAERRRKAEETKRRRKEEEDERKRREAAEAERRKQAGAMSAGGSVAGSTRSAGKGKGKATESTGEAPEGTEGGVETEESVRLAVKCRVCTAKHRDCRAVFKGGKPMACEPCRKSKAKCSLLPEAERKRERAGTVASPCGGEKRKKSKIAVAIAEGESAWDSDGEHKDNRDALGTLSQSMMGLSDEVREFRMDFRRGLRLLERVAFALESLAQVETRSEHEYPTDDDAEGPVASGSGRK
ncbi:hypothetical protein BV22DRAFT_1135031 [Leucogyrophana mollusca]|uniref:Uncharacterized protein n=1 Tax=Leucogyrophana mollusca TaxID=85980 RepID=A0ACB8AXB5_9AGAM|nr:hypothetical protein BV22DRAFT_1135031 [Leucogyrophana mollusca]